MKKAQLDSPIFKIILFVVVALVLISIGVSLIKTISRSTSAAETANFIKTIENSLKEVKEGKYGKSGSVKELVLLAPSGVEEVCFTDRNKAFTTSRPEFEIYDSDNLFLYSAIQQML